MDAPGVLCTNLENKIAIEPKTFFFTGVLNGAAGTEIYFGESETLGSLLLSKREYGLINPAVVIVNTHGTSPEPTNSPCSGC